MKLRFIALGLACASAAFAGPPDPGRLREYVTPGFTLITDDDSEARRVLKWLPNFERVLAKTLQREPEPKGTPALIYIVSGAVWSRYLQPGASIAAEFVPTRFASYLLVNGGNGMVRESLMHEYTHYYLRSQFHGFHPLWFAEGIAELMQHTSMRGEYARIDVPESRLARMPGIPVPRLLALDRKSPEYLSQSMTSSVHSMSWAMVHRGLVADKDFGVRMFSYLRALNDLVPIEDAVRSSFGMTLAELDDDMRSYVKRGLFFVSRVDFTRTAPLPADDGRPLSDPEGYEAIATAMLDTGFNSRNLREVIDAAGRVAPGSARVGVLRARMAARDRDDTMLDSLHAALAPGASPRTARDLGLALFERVRTAPAGDPLPAQPRAELEGRAFALLDRGFEKEQPDPEAAWAYALLAAQRRENLGVALARLAIASRRSRDDPHLALAKALVHEANGDSEATLAALGDAARFSTSLEERAAIVRRAQELREQLRASAPQ